MKGHLKMLLLCSGGSLEGVFLADLGFAVAAEQCECTECNGAVTDWHGWHEWCGVILCILSSLEMPAVLLGRAFPIMVPTGGRLKL